MAGDERTENPYAAAPPLAEPADHDDRLARRGRVIVTAVIAFFVFFAVAEWGLLIYVAIALRVGVDRVFSQALKFACLVALCSSLYHGQSWARLLLIGWYALRIALVARAAVAEGLPTIGSGLLLPLLLLIVAGELAAVIALSLPSVSHFLRVRRRQLARSADIGGPPPDLLEECPWCDEFVVRTEVDTCPNCDRPM